MIRVLFFARLREQLGTAAVELEFSSCVNNLERLQQYLGEQHGEMWSTALGAANVVRAVNQEVVDLRQELHDGDEVAFFPPVTGG